MVNPQQFYAVRFWLILPKIVVASTREVVPGVGLPNTSRKKSRHQMVSTPFAPLELRGAFTACCYLRRFYDALECLLHIFIRPHFALVRCLVCRRQLMFNLSATDFDIDAGPGESKRQGQETAHRQAETYGKNAALTGKLNGVMEDFLRVHLVGCSLASCFGCRRLGRSASTRTSLESSSPKTDNC